MIRKTGVIITIILILSVRCLAQPATEWRMMYDFGEEECYFDIYRSSGEGYILCGYSSPNGHNQIREMLVTRINDEGNVNWSDAYGAENGFSYCMSVIETDANTFMVAGEEIGEVAVLHLDAEGEELWLNRFADSGNAYAVIELKNGSFWACGISNRRGYIVSFDIDGNVSWEDTYGNEDSYGFCSMRETQGGVVLCGQFREEPDTDWHPWIVKVDFEGDVIWERLYDFGNRLECLNSMVSTGDGGFVASGRTGEASNRNHLDVLVMKIDSEGNPVWHRSFNLPREEWRNLSFCVERLDDDGFVVVGSENSGAASDIKPFALRLTPNGQERWHAVYDYDEEDEIGDHDNMFLSVTRGHDDSIIACGTINMAGGDWGDQNGLVVKLDYEPLSPVFLFYEPEDTVFTVLRGDTIDFQVSAIDVQGDSLSFKWLLNGFRIDDTDSSTAIVFDSLGVQTVTCQVSDGEFNSEINWSVTVTECFISGFSPDSLYFSIMRDEIVPFTVEVSALDDLEYSFRWTHIDLEGDREVEGNEEVSVDFDISGDHRVKCEVLFGDSVDSVTWLVHATDFRIASRDPDVPELSLRRNSSQDFSVDVEVHEDVHVSYLWTLARDEDWEEIGEEASESVHFPRTGDYSLTCAVSCGEDVVPVAWNIHVLSCLWSWYPEALSFRVEKDSTVNFHLEPFNPASDSLSYEWMLEGEILEADSTSDLSLQFPDEAELVLTGIVTDGSEADTVEWEIEVFDPADVTGDSRIMPEAISLSSPVPNPFNSETRINFGLPSASDVSLKVYDLNGRLVTSLLESSMTAGYHSIVFDAADLPGGLYLVRLDTGRETLTQKAVVIK